MQNTTKNRKIVLGHNGAKGYEIKKVMESLNENNKDDVTEVYASREIYDNYINAGERDQEAFFAGFSGEADEILAEIEADEDIDTELFGLHCTLEYAETLPYEKMREEIKNAMKHINAIRAEHSENTQEKLDALLAGQQSKPTQEQPIKPPFEYKPHTNLIDDAAEQLSKYYCVSFMDARGAMEQAIKEVETIPDYNNYRDPATNKIGFEEVVKYASRLLLSGGIPF